MAKFYFYYAAMNAGKSTNLLQSAHNYEERYMKTIIFTPKLDDRYGVGKVASRIGLDREAEIFEGEDETSKSKSVRSGDTGSSINSKFLTDSHTLYLLSRILIKPTWRVASRPSFVHGDIATSRLVEIGGSQLTVVNSL